MQPISFLRLQGEGGYYTRDFFLIVLLCGVDVLEDTDAPDFVFAPQTQMWCLNARFFPGHFAVRGRQEYSNAPDFGSSIQKWLLQSQFLLQFFYVEHQTT